MTTSTVTREAPPASTERNAHLFGRSYRATGYSRIGFAPIATGDVPGQGPSRLALPVESVVAVDARTRPGLRTSITVVAADALDAPARAAAQYLVDHCGLSGEIRLTVRHPYATLGSGLLEATAAATLDALGKAEELSMSAPRRAEIVATLVSDAAGLALGTPAVVNSAGRAVHALHEPARLLLVTAALKGHTEPSPARAGSLLAPPADVSTAAAVAEWLVRCAAPGTSDAFAALSEVAGPAALGVIGGATPTAPVAIVLDAGPASLTLAQKLVHRAHPALAALAPAGKDAAVWRVGMLRSAAHSAAL